MNNRPLAGILATLFVTLAALPGSRTLADTAGFLKPVDARHVSVSPDGKHVAMVQGRGDKDRLILFRRPLSGRDSIVAGAESANGEQFHRITWVGSENVLIEPAVASSFGQPPTPTGALLRMGVDTSRKIILRANPSATPLTTAVVSVLPDEPNHVLIAAHSQCDSECGPVEKNQRRLARLDLTNDSLSTIGADPGMDAYYVSSPDGKRVLAAGRSADGTVTVSNFNGAEWTPITSFDPTKEVGTVPVAIDQRGTVYALVNRVGTADLSRWDPASGKTEALYRNGGSDLSTLMTDYAGRLILAARTDAGFANWHYLQAEHPFTEFHKALRAAHPDSDVDVTSFTADETEAVVHVHGQSNPGQFFLVDVKTRETRLLGTARPWLTKKSLPIALPFEVTTRDNFALRGYITEPERAGPHPLVVWLHDRSAIERADTRFNPEVQMLVERGFAVLQVNYRGSGGLGAQYIQPANRNDGQVVQQDIADATRWAVDEGIAREDAICVYGRGYGAFAAAKALATNSRLYQCAVAADGFYDAAATRNAGMASELTPQSLLQPPTRLDLDDASRTPVERVGNIEGSLLLAGDDAQTRAMADALTKLDKPVEQLPALATADAFDQMLNFLERALKTTETGGVDMGFGQSLTPQQAAAFQKIVDTMRDELETRMRRRVASPHAVRREIERVIERHDNEVRGIVDDAQWQTYPAFKSNLATQLAADYDVVQIN